MVKTGTCGFRVQSANHYPLGPVVKNEALLIDLNWLICILRKEKKRL